MLPNLHLCHLPALFIAFTQTIGGLWPIIGPTRSAMREFGFPTRIADSREAQTAFIAGASRISVIGVLMFTLYAQGKYEDLDAVMVVLGLVGGLVDGYVLCVRERVVRWGLVRAACGLTIAVWGGFGMTGASVR